MKLTVYHGGSLGDAIYALPACRLAYEYSSQPVNLIFSEFAPAYLPSYYVESIRPLLKLQNYIDGVFYNKELNFTDTPDVISLANFRANYVKENLAVWQIKMMCKSLGIIRNIKVEDISPWIHNIKPNRVTKVVIHRSLRYHNDNFPWKYIVNKFKNDAIIVGNKDGSREVEIFCEEFGSIQYYPTHNLLQLAEVIKGADYFIGNQSTPMAIANGLGVKTVLEECQSLPNSTFSREGCLPQFIGQQVIANHIDLL